MNAGFAHPLWLLALLLVPLLIAAYVANRRRAKRYAVRFTGVSSLRLAAGATPAWRKHLPAALALLAMSALVFALAKPQHTVAVPVERASIMLVTDHSRSMQANDVQPTRLDAGKRAADGFIGKLPSAIRVGVVTYSDRPDAVQAPTNEHDATRTVVDNQVADGGTATGDALQVAITTLDQDRQNGKRPPSAIILLSDGATTVGSDPIPVAQRAGQLKIPIYTVALGTTDATVPNPGFGPPIPVPPDPQTLSKIAEASKGRAFTAEDEGKLANIYKSLGSQLGTKSQKAESTATFAVVGLLLLAGAGLASVRFAGRLP
ncbi:MAG: VWA domain-containing protein [Thermoleophilaceae bacterium]